MRFKIKYFVPLERRFETKVLEVPDLAAAETWVAQQGYKLITVAANSKWLIPGKNTFDVQLFCREVASLLAAGMTIVEALDALISRAREHVTVQIQSAILKRLQEGRPLSLALNESGFDFPEILVAAISSSERSGRVQEALDEYLKYAQMVNQSKSRLINAVIYPLFVCGIGLLVSLFLLGFVVPRFGAIYENHSSSISAATTIVLATGKFVAWFGPWIAFVILAVLFVFIYGARLPIVRFHLTAFFLTVGPIRKLAESFQLARIHRTVAMLLRGGFPMVEAMQRSSSLAFDANLATRFQNAIIRISEGQPISESLFSEKIVDAVGVRLMAVGERNSRLDRSLDTIALDLQTALDAKIDRITRMAEPILIFIVAAMIGAIVVMMYMPIFDLAGGIL